MSRKSPQYLYQVPRIYEGLEYLLEHDPVFKKLGLKPEDIKRTYTGPGFAGLVRIVIGQQVSTQAAQSMWEKFEQGMPIVSPNAVLVLTVEEMRSFGLSHQKARYIRELAQAINDGNFDPIELENHSDEEVYESITALTGFGNWSAEMFLLFGLARPDIWPDTDLGIQEGLRLYLGLDERPDAAMTYAEGQKLFQGKRSAATLLLWHLKSLGAEDKN